MGKSRDDENLARQIPDDPRAFALLYDRLGGRIRALCRRLLGSAAAADDAAHEVFIRADRARATYDPSRPFAPWILRIAANVCLDELRRRRREHALFEPLEADGWGPAGRSPTSSPLSLLVREEERRALRSALDGLPERERTLVSLRYDAEMSYQEIAHAVGIEPGHVGVLIYRAKARLRAALAGVGGMSR